jgi:hypothetical protein
MLNLTQKGAGVNAETSVFSIAGEGESHIISRCGESLKGKQKKNRKSTLDTGQGL